MTVIKSTHGCSGAYGFDAQQKDPYAVKPWFINPFNPPQKIFWLICPSHQVIFKHMSKTLMVLHFAQLKNMINALHSSRNGGTKNFMFNGNYFGWKTIINMYERECNRVSNGIARMVPKLRETHIIRDSWTKLNVSPAKIMQVRKTYFLIIHTVYIYSRNK